jgi:carbamoyl-phosphate synthase small subunit
LNEKLKLVLEDATEYVGYNFGYFARTEGEIVFNTGMIGYPETLTDPSYFGQILVETYPLIGNYGVPNKSKKNGILQFFESDKIQIRALIVNDYSFEFSHWNADKSLADWLVEEKIPAIYGIDTRALTRKLRDKGTMLAKIVFENENADFSNIIDPNEQNLFHLKLNTQKVKVE